MDSGNPKSPLRTVDPRPMRDQSPVPVSEPERTKAYPGPSSQPYGPQPSGPQPYGPEPYNPQQDYASHSYSTQNYTSQSYGSQSYAPQKHGPQPYNPQDYPPVSGPPGPPGPSNNLPLRPGPDPNMQNYNGAMATKPGPQFGPPPTATTMIPTTLRELGTLRTNCQFGLREYLSLQRQRRSGDSVMSTYELDNRLQYQAAVLLSDLKVLQGEVRGIAKEAENHRWRRWIIGGAVAIFIPVIRRFWRRGNDHESRVSSNDTEYAFRKSKGLVEHIKNALLGRGRFAKLAFFVFAVLIVFSNEVSIRVARTVQKRLKKLCYRIEQGDPDIDEKDMKLLEGWRWRILLW